MAIKQISATILSGKSLSSSRKNGVTMKQKNHRILLIEPPFYRLFKTTYSLDKYPLSLGYLAGTIKEDTDWDVLVYNADFSHKSVPMSISYLSGDGFYNYRNNLKRLRGRIWQEIEATIRDYKPSVVGITCKTQNFESATIVARIAKEIGKNIIVIVGGPHPSMAYADTIKRSEFDICVRGEGEKTIVELLGKIDDRKEWKDIPGICYQENGQLVVTAERELMADLDSLCFPNEYAETVLKDYKKYHKNAFRYIFAVRGCPFKCWFCGSHRVWSRKVRWRSPENVANEINLLRKRGINSIHFDDDTFGVSKDYIVDICNRILKCAPGTTWSCEINVKLIDDDTLKLMKESGCTSIELGIESGNNEILKKIRKNMTIDQAIAACNKIKEYNIGLRVFFMVGFPWETVGTLQDTLDAIKKIKADTTIYSIFMPYPGTEAFDFCKINGLVPDDFDLSLYNHQSPENCFCLNIDHKTFRLLVQGIEREVDSLNSQSRRRYMIQKLKTFSINEIVCKVRNYGLLNSVRRIL